MRIGLLTGNSLSAVQLNRLMPILKDDSFSVELAIIDESPKKSIKQKLKKNIRKGRGGYILIMAYQRFFRKKGIIVRTEKFCKENGIPVHKTENIYSQEIIDNIRKYNLDTLLLIGGYGIIKEPLLSISKIGVLSYHHGNMRKYRGMPPALWELYNGEKEMGVTIQILASGLDCGIPVEEKTIEINENDTLKKLNERALQESSDMMYKALKKLSNKDFVPAKIERFGKIYTLPNLKQWIILNIKILWRRIK